MSIFFIDGEAADLGEIVEAGIGGIQLGKEGLQGRSLLCRKTNLVSHQLAIMPKEEDRDGYGFHFI